MSNPRIRLTGAGYWACTANNRDIGRGRTPGDAYVDWLCMCRGIAVAAKLSARPRHGVILPRGRTGGW